METIKIENFKTLLGLMYRKSQIFIILLHLAIFTEGMEFTIILSKTTEFEYNYVFINP